VSSPVARAAREAARTPQPCPAVQPASGLDHPAPDDAPSRQTRPEMKAAAPGSVPLRRPGAAAAFRRGRTTAQGVVASLAIPASPPSLPGGPPPLTGLHRLPRDTSMLYDIGQVDASGRVASRDIVAALCWQPRDRLELILTAGAIVLRRSSDGLFRVPQGPRIVIPVRARRCHAIRPRDHVLLAAAPDYGTVIVYPLSALDEMIANYHSAHHATGASRT
jgi:bifunctional DNA-binding transcriptional regulator/antitoxin component of YhaV-PrlF toxin-antitoxin module